MGRADILTCPERPETPLEPLSTVQFVRYCEFIGRGSLLEKLEDGHKKDVPRIALVGLGGVGYAFTSILHCLDVEC